MEKDIIRNEERINDHERRINKLESLQEQLTDLTRQTAVMLNTIEGLRESFKKIDKVIQDLSDKMRNYEMEPATKWKKATWLVFTLLASAVVGLTLTIVGITVR